MYEHTAFQSKITTGLLNSTTKCNSHNNREGVKSDVSWNWNCLGLPKIGGSIRQNKDIDRDGEIGKVGMYFSIGALINNEFQGSGADEIFTFPHIQYS